MNIISWNVNGIRACHKKGCWDWLIKESPDILCLQETKAHPDQLPEEVRNPKGFSAYFDHAKTKKGYSGVALYTKQRPEKVEIGLGIPELDQEGRMVTALFKNFAISNAYFPNGGGGPHRIKFKLEFYKAFLAYVERLRAKGFKVIFCGDVNTAHEEIDLARPKENEKNTGFLPEERAWIDEVISKGYIDIFRKLNPETRDAYTYWDMKTFARVRNVGWRIDYFFISPDTEKNVISTKILKDVTGSDHCPISLTLKGLE
ncbi:MAG: exodeoxyribonuclease III [Patescibacteria group bacterium]|nr:exodeoxyribonuclease III [bacterium]MDZ4241076.1 exodeoxyribonuclease III [Patescibacteria group bacterium]